MNNYQTSLFETKKESKTTEKSIRLELDEILKNLLVTRGNTFKKKGALMLKTKLDK